MAGGLMSNHLNDVIKTGDKIQIMKPMGMFTTDYSSSNRRHLVFFGGGSGITPLYSILRTVLLIEPHSKVSLVYGNKSEQYIIFYDSINQLKKEYKERFKVIHILEEGKAEYSGRMTTQFISDITSTLGCDSETEFFICGPQPMMDIVVSGLEQKGFASDKVKLESFDAGKTSPDKIIDDDKSKSEVTIILNGEQHEIIISKAASILDTALDEGLDMPYSCQSGLCTACRGKCLEGTVSVKEAEGLSQEELDEGFILTCVGTPAIRQNCHRNELMSF